MQIFIGCVDGRTYYSDYYTDAEVVEQIKNAGGMIGTGDLAGKQFTLDDLLEMFTDVLEKAFEYDKATISLEINGKSRTFQARHVVWWQIIRD